METLRRALRRSRAPRNTPAALTMWGGGDGEGKVVNTRQNSVVRFLFSAASVGSLVSTVGARQADELRIVVLEGDDERAGTGRGDGQPGRERRGTVAGERGVSGADGEVIPNCAGGSGTAWEFRVSCAVP